MSILCLEHGLSNEPLTSLAEISDADWTIHTNLPPIDDDFVGVSPRSVIKLINMALFIPTTLTPLGRE